MTTSDTSAATTRSRHSPCSKKQLARFIKSSGSRQHIGHTELSSIGYLNVQDRVTQLSVNMMHNIFYDRCQAYMKSFLPRSVICIIITQGEATTTLGLQKSITSGQQLFITMQQQNETCYLIASNTYGTNLPSKKKSDGT